MFNEIICEYMETTVLASHFIVTVESKYTVYTCAAVFSAGIGRTGAYIALDSLTREGEAEGAVEIPGCIINMRQNRTNMVQTAVRLAHSKYLNWSLVLLSTHFYELFRTAQ